MKKIIVIGGGLAGLSASVLLSKKNYHVTILEASPKLGGRTWSLFDSKKNFSYDNGQHLLMSCYDNTLSYLRLIGSISEIDIIKGIFIPFISRNAESFHLVSESNLYPFNLIAAILRFRILTMSERLSVLRFLFRLKFTDTKKLKHIDIKRWLEKNNQTPDSVKFLWEVLAVGTLNASLEQSSAETFAKVLKEIFLNRTDGYRFIVPKVGLSDLFVKNSIQVIEQCGGKVKTSEKVEKLVYSGKNILNIETNKGYYKNFDYIISAVPLYALDKLLSEHNFCNSLHFDYNPIVSLQLKTDTSGFGEKYFAFLDSPVQWVFVHDDHLSIVISNAGNFVDYSKHDLAKLIIDELEIHFPFFSGNDVDEVVVLKEKRATFVPSPDSEKLRVNVKSPFDNLFLAGDWTNTGLPSTIESAVKSGFETAENIIRL